MLSDSAPNWYLRADLGHGLADSDPVDLILHQGSEATALSPRQSTPANRPTYLFNGGNDFGNRPVIDFSLGDVLYSLQSSAWHLAEGDVGTWLFVFRPRQVGAAGDLMRTLDYATQGGWFIRPSTLGNWTVASHQSGGGGSLSSFVSALVADEVVVLRATYTGAVSPTNDTVRAYNGGVAGTEGSADLGAIAAAADREIILGGSALTTGTADMQLAEAAFWKRALSEAELETRVPTYLNDRYSFSLDRI